MFWDATLLLILEISSIANATSQCTSGKDCFNDETVCAQVSEWECLCLPHSFDQIPCNNHPGRNHSAHNFGLPWSPDYKSERNLQLPVREHTGLSKEYSNKVDQTLSLEDDTITQAADIFGISAAAFVICGVFLPLVCVLGCCMCACIAFYYFFSFAEPEANPTV